MQYKRHCEEKFIPSWKDGHQWLCFDKEKTCSAHCAVKTSLQIVSLMFLYKCIVLNNIKNKEYFLNVLNYAIWVSCNFIRFRLYCVLGKILLLKVANFALFVNALWKIIRAYENLVGLVKITSMEVRRACAWKSFSWRLCIYAENVLSYWARQWLIMDEIRSLQGQCTPACVLLSTEMQCLIWLR